MVGRVFRFLISFTTLGMVVMSVYVKPLSNETLSYMFWFFVLYALGAIPLFIIIKVNSTSERPLLTFLYLFLELQGLTYFFAGGFSVVGIILALMNNEEFAGLELIVHVIFLISAITLWIPRSPGVVRTE